jgi:hypothetical protein
VIEKQKKWQKKTRVMPKELCVLEGVTEYKAFAIKKIFLPL